MSDRRIRALWNLLWREITYTTEKRNKLNFKIQFTGIT